METIIFVSLLFFTTHIQAKSSLSGIADGEFNMDGKACWLSDSKDETILYDDMKVGRVKLNGKIIELKRKSGKFGEKFFLCGETYSYGDKRTTITVKMDSGKDQNCSGTITIGKETVKRLKPHCGE